MKPAFFAKDFIQTDDGLCFAVVKNGTELNKVLSFLRYASIGTGWQKLNTVQANQLLQQKHPHYLHYSKPLDAHLHGVEFERIAKHYQPKQRLQHLLNSANTHDRTAQTSALNDLLSLCRLLEKLGIALEQIGVTGSLLIGAQTADSDIDLVFYQPDTFQHARTVVAQLIQQGQCQTLTAQDWQQAFQRRDCALSFADYLWHEQRKYNKALINGRKFDLSLVTPSLENEDGYRKLGSIKLIVQVSDDRYAFDYPAKFLLAHPEIQSLLCFTATYHGQACSGEWIEVAGQLEVSPTGTKRIVVGSTREAWGEYIKVVH